ncbi:Ppx/GppA phosphatase family protein [Streptomyces nodosus]|uniref:Ppx/GppA phosphatase family protein n=1 Tax=Streptomyces nodosus TaxID=40318 RepID=UPI0036E0860D
MRQAGVLDVGCHSALLTVARRPRAGVLEPVLSRKVRLALHRSLGPDGRLRRPGIRSVQRAVAEAVAADQQLPEVYAFATSVIRDAPNRDEVIDRVARVTGIRLRVLPGKEEARLAYVAARRWAGPAVGPLLVLDIGGGTVEIASGTAGQPRAVYSLLLGARTVTREHLPGGTVSSKRCLAEVRRHLRRSLSAVPGLPQAEPGGHVVACSKTFTQLARLAAARNGPSTPRRLTLPGLRATLPLLAAAAPEHRGTLPGITPHRAEQSLAGALVAEALMEACGSHSVTICPWSTREGLLLERLSSAPAG